MDEDRLTQLVETIVEARPETPIDAPRDRRALTVEEVWEEGPAYLGLRVRVDGAFAEAYRRPGQYVTMTPDALEPRFVVIANAPDRARREHEGWEFLIDRRSQLGQALGALEAGATLSVSAPEGPGFPTETVPGRDLLCFVTGSGIASIRPAIQHWYDAPEDAPASITIYYGEGGRDAFAYPDELYDWSQRGIRIFRCWESIDGDADGHRYVQDAFDVDAPDLQDVEVFIAGARPMKRIVAQRLLQAGVAFDRIFTNVGVAPPRADAPRQ